MTEISLRLIFNNLNLSVKNFIKEAESTDYAAATFNLNHHKILFRASKITPTKTGQFVTLWKRINNGPIQPFDLSDPIDYVIISVRSDDQLGQFIFPKKIMCEKKIFSVNHRGGKRAIRVYAPWDIANSKQALSTKKWQSEFFVDICEKESLFSTQKVTDLLKA